ncbi:MAG: ABC transporter ATP-binding protein, partial [archaeon]|nr:ABC transporter ATP-binding protein [archaeon]
SSYQEAKATNEQLEEILKMQPKPKPKNAIVLGALKSIDFKDVSFTYSSANIPSAKNISLSINAGETIAFAGPSGSGKSTLIKLLVGLYEPVDGKILFNNVDSKQIDFDELRKRVGLVSQDTQLFAGAIRENLLFVNPKASDDDCLKVLEMASVMGIIERGGKGLDTKIGEGGIKLSGGEKQRLAIARALLRNPDLIIFDEATSSLDSITEKSIIETIQQIAKSKPNLMIVMVAHRLSTIAHAKKIFVLEKGSIAETGTHDQLLKLKGLYSLFWREQSGANSFETEKEIIKKR